MNEGMIRYQVAVLVAFVWATAVHAARTTDGDNTLHRRVSAYHALVIHRETVL